MFWKIVVYTVLENYCKCRFRAVLGKIINAVLENDDAVFAVLENDCKCCFGN